MPPIVPWLSDWAARAAHLGVPQRVTADHNEPPSYSANYVVPLRHSGGMTAVLFHPHWARTLRALADGASSGGTAQLRVPSHLDRRVVELQVDQYLQAVGAAGRIDVVRGEPAGSRRRTESMVSASAADRSSTDHAVTQPTPAR